MHPIGVLDHVLAMVAGGAAALDGIAVPFVELGIGAAMSLAGVAIVTGLV